MKALDLTQTHAAAVKVGPRTPGFSLPLLLMLLLAMALIAAVAYHDMQMGSTALVIAVVCSVSRRLLKLLFSPRTEFVRDTPAAQLAPLELQQSQ